MVWTTRDFYPCIEGFSTLNKLCLYFFFISILGSIFHWCSSQVLASLGEFIFAAYYSVIEFIIVLAYFLHHSVADKEHVGWALEEERMKCFEAKRSHQQTWLRVPFVCTTKLRHLFLSHAAILSSRLHEYNFILFAGETRQSGVLPRWKKPPSTLSTCSFCLFIYFTFFMYLVYTLFVAFAQPSFAICFFLMLGFWAQDSMSTTLFCLQEKQDRVECFQGERSHHQPWVQVHFVCFFTLHFLCTWCIHYLLQNIKALNWHYYFLYLLHTGYVHSVRSSALILFLHEPVYLHIW